MARVLTDSDPEDETVAIYQWRLEELERAGYSAAAASTLAFRDDVDLHEAAALVKSGCPEELALEILL